MEDFNSDEDQLTPPQPPRVAARAITLTTLAYRGILEPHAADPDAVAFWNQLRGWYYSLGIEAEAEPEEAAVLNAALGRLQPQQAINASWRTEGAAVLAWALQCYELPAHDANANIDDICTGLGFMRPAEETALSTAQLRPAAAIEQYGSVALTIHWRLREYSLRPQALNFVEFVRGAQWGPLSLEGVVVSDHDLAIDGQPINEADKQAVRVAQSTAQERHQAVNWLMGWAELYSDVDTGT
jgi:hypothetical protein